MADTETKDTKAAASPEKKVIEEEKKEVEEDSKASKNGVVKDIKQNGNVKEVTENTEEEEETKEEEEEEEDEADEKQAESTENGESTDAPADSCPTKRKSTALNDGTEEAATDGASPEKKARHEEKCAEVKCNRDAETTA